MSDTSETPEKKPRAPRKRTTRKSTAAKAPKAAADDDFGAELDVVAEHGELTRVAAQGRPVRRQNRNAVTGE